MKISFKGRPNFLKEAGVLMEFNYAKKHKENYKTYLFEIGGDSRNVQELLGHYFIPIPIGIYPCGPEKPSKKKESI